MDKAKKKLVKRYVTWGAIAALVLVLTAMPLLAKSEAEADGPVASILSAQVAVGDIPQTLHGGGTLESLGEADVQIPSGVKITEFLVSNGDTVQEGDPVARVDKVSVMTAIMEVNESMRYLQKELEAGRNEKVDSTIYATAGGRVKRVFVWPGDDVQDAMLTHGALALLSIDGLMAVELDVDSPVTTGESVTVTFSGGAKIQGRVESNLNHQVVVTVQDNGYAIGESVTVTQSDGTEIGKGELYVHNAWKATAYSGTISAVNIQEEQVLSVGTAMFSLTDREYEGQLSLRASQHRSYEALLQRLMAMYESGTITAPCAGTVSGVDEDSAHLLSAEASDAQITLLEGSDRGTVKLMLLGSSGLTTTCQGNPDVDNCMAGAGKHIQGCKKFDCTDASSEADCEASTHNSGCIHSCNPASCTATGSHKDGCITFCPGGADPDKCKNPVNGNHKSDCIHKCTSSQKENDPGKCSGGANHYSACIESCDGATTEGGSCDATGTHKVGCIRSCLRASVTGICKPNTTGMPHYTDCIEKCGSSQTVNDVCLASKHKADCYFNGMTYTATVAKVDSVGNAELVVYWDASGTSYPVTRTGSGWSITGGAFDESLLVSRGTLKTDNAQQFKKGDIVLYVTGTKNGQPEDLGVEYYKSSSAASFGGFSASTEDNASNMVGSFSGYGGSTSTASSADENLYSLKESTLMTVTGDAGYTIEISLDERDIHKVQVGQEATIRLEAVRGEVFTGTVTRVGAIGTHSGDTGKFQVKVQTGSIPGSLPGMSAMVKIQLETHQDVLTLPVAAVDQDGAKTVVYTALDSKTGQPTAPKEITTGVSDGETVEVIGLDEGTKVYYSYYDVLEIDDSAEEQKFTMA